MSSALIPNSPIVITDRSIQVFDAANDVRDATVTVSGMRLVDVSKSPWEQILDFRKDQDSKKKLEKLRLHLAYNYIGLQKEQIEAGILLDIDQYEQAAKKHGFELAASLLQATLDVKTLLGTSTAGTLIGHYAVGESVAGLTIGAMAGTALELGKITISVTSGVYSRKSMKNNHPMAYVIKAKEYLEV